MAVTISTLASQTDVSTDTLRYYERRGLLAEPARSAGGYRLYDDDARRRVQFIKDAQRAGLRLDDIGELLEVLDRGACPCGHAAELVERRLREVDEEIARLEAVRGALVEAAERISACTEIDVDQWWCATALRRGGDD